MWWLLGASGWGNEKREGAHFQLPGEAALGV